MGFGFIYTWIYIKLKYLFPIKPYSLYQTFLVTLDEGERPFPKKSNKKKEKLKLISENEKDRWRQQQTGKFSKN